MSASSTAGRIGIWGASGSGKSSYVKEQLKGRKRMVVFDPLDEYGPLCNVRATTLEQVRVAIRDNWDGFTVAYVPPAGKEARALSSLSKLIMMAQSVFKSGKSKQILTLVVEEMNLSFPVAGGAEKSRGFAEICSRGRHFGVEVFGLSQRIAEVSTRFRGNCTETVILRQQGPRDIDAAASAIGASKSTVQALKNLDYIHEKNGDKTAGRINFANAGNKKRTA